MCAVSSRECMVVSQLSWTVKCVSTAAAAVWPAAASKRHAGDVTSAAASRLDTKQHCCCCTGRQVCVAVGSAAVAHPSAWLLLWCTPLLMHVNLQQRKGIHQRSRPSGPKICGLVVPALRTAATGLSLFPAGQGDREHIPARFCHTSKHVKAAKGSRNGRMARQLLKVVRRQSDNDTQHVIGMVFWLADGGVPGRMGRRGGRV
jgi:hypothetical protein